MVQHHNSCSSEAAGDEAESLVQVALDWAACLSAVPCTESGDQPSDVFLGQPTRLGEELAGRQRGEDATETAVTNHSDATRAAIF